MAKGRMINNAIAFDAKIHRLSSDTSRLAFTWLITFADCEGRTYGDPAIVRSMVFPRRTDVSIDDMAGYIAEWTAEKLVVVYAANGDTWIQFTNFDKNQIGLRKDREAPSAIPAPPVRNKSGAVPELVPVKLTEEKLKEEEENKPAPAFPFSEYNDFQDHELAKASPPQRIMEAACGTLGTDAVEQFQVVEGLIDTHGEQKTEDALRSCYTRWIKTKSKTTGRYYSSTNYKGFVDWTVQLLNTGVTPWQEEKKAVDKYAEAGYK